MNILVYSQTDSNGTGTHSTSLVGLYRWQMARKLYLLLQLRHLYKELNLLHQELALFCVKMRSDQSEFEELRN